MRIIYKEETPKQNKQGSQSPSVWMHFQGLTVYCETEPSIGSHGDHNVEHGCCARRHVHAKELVSLMYSLFGLTSEHRAMLIQNKYSKCLVYKSFDQKTLERDSNEFYFSTPL